MPIRMPTPALRIPLQSRAVQPRLLRWTCAAFALALVVALAAYAWRGIYSRYITDDYCTASKLRNLGFVEAMKWHRTNWSGRYSYYAVKAIPEAIGPGTAPVMPALMIVSFCVSMIWTIRRAMDPGPLVAAASGFAVVFATIDATPEVLAVGGPLIWETGSITYMLPLVLYAAWAGVFFGPRSLGLRCALSAAILFVAGGLSETSLAAQAAIAGGALFVAVVRRLPDATRIAATGFAATVLSALVSVTAPGNVRRMSELPPQPPLLDAIGEALRLAYRYVGSNVFVGGASLVAIVGCGLLLGTKRDRRDLPVLLLLALTCLGAFIGTLVPSTWMLSTSPPPRALHVSNFFFIATTLFLAAALAACRPAGASIAAAVLLVLSVPIALHSAATVVNTFEEGRRHAAEVDRIAAILRASKGKDVRIVSPYAIGARLLVPDAEFWTNTCICDYYGVRSLVVTR